MRLGVFVDYVYRADGGTISTERAFVQFVLGLRSHVDRLVLLGRLHPEPGRDHYELPPDVDFVALPHYPRVSDARALAAALRRSTAVFERELERLDAVWLFGPHPLSLRFARLARAHGKRVFLGVRQDMAAYVGSRIRGPARPAALAAAHTLETAYRLLARRRPTVVVGEALGRRYGRSGGPLLVTGFSLIRERDLVAAEQAVARPWDGPLRLLSVGRLEPEKNPLLLPEILAGARARGGDWRLEVVGIGELADAVRRRAGELGVGDVLELRGYVNQGPDLNERYRAANVFLHVSLTEGLPQVLFEAAAAGTPVVATDVGGVRDALRGGELGLLVPPQDAGAAIDALERLRAEPEQRERFVRTGLAHVAGETLDAQLDRIAAFFGL